jgi:hypothetical protein
MTLEQLDETHQFCSNPESSYFIEKERFLGVAGL